MHLFPGFYFTLARSNCILLIVLWIAFSSSMMGAMASHSILSYGAIPNDASNHAAWMNSAAIMKAMYAANSSSDRSVVIPSNADFYILETEVSQLYDVTLKIDGNLFVSNNISAWPTSNPNHILAALYIGDSSGITLEGHGVFDGQGYDWWWYVIITTIDNRPMLVAMERVSNLVIRHVHFKNSPQFHLDLRDIKDVHIYEIDIHVDVEKQKQLLSDHGLLDEFGIPTFPLNTDGIDPQGINVLIENVTIENFDDAVAVKPQHGGNYFSNCSSNMLIRNSHVSFGVGLTIGSVPPHEHVNCISNITFNNITMKHPIKAIYIKTNPGDTGTGLIKNITYANLKVDRSLWYPIWIGPQQQRQPGTAGTGCSFFYPIVDVCPTQPRVPISNIVLVNITMENGLLLPGVFLCNATNPCHNFYLENVQNSGRFLVQDDYVCQNVEGFVTNSLPAPSCLQSISTTNADSDSDSDSDTNSDLDSDSLQIISQLRDAS